MRKSAEAGREAKEEGRKGGRKGDSVREGMSEDAWIRAKEQGDRTTDRRVVHDVGDQSRVLEGRRV